MAAVGRTPRLMGILVGAAIVGLGVFAILTWRAVTVEQATPAEALQRFEAVRERFGTTPPLLELDSSGRLTRWTRAPRAVPVRVRRLEALAYQRDAARLVHADVPFWFFKLKAPAAEYALRGTGLDLTRLGVTAEDLERHGPGLVIDHTSGGENRLLVWIE